MIELAHTTGHPSCPRGLPEAWDLKLEDKLGLVSQSSLLATLFLSDFLGWLHLDPTSI